HQWGDPFQISTAMQRVLIVVTMLSLGMLVRPEELRPLRQRPWWVMLGVAVQMTAMPAAAWLMVQLVPMSSQWAAGVLLVGCVPGAMASNVLTNTAGGSVAYSVSLTAVATLLSPLTVPGWLWILFDEQMKVSQVQLLKISLLLFVMVVLPTIVGYGLARKSAAIRRLAQRYGSFIASLALLWIIASVVADNRQRLLEGGGLLVVALLAINLMGYAAGYSTGRIAKLPPSFGKALTLEVGMQNAALGTVLANSLFGQGAGAAVPTAMYTFGCMLTGTLLAVFWRRRWNMAAGRDQDSTANRDGGPGAPTSQPV
ncbi:MAG: bile acid:sodium symporter family protein, partial [Pirellulales bacterium]|nr:bile acid:sodium symporter family protein [Pirellulales bacterium]